MDACLANPAASIDLHEVLYGMVTPAGGPWGFWGSGLKKMVAPISSIANFGMSAFRNNQSRDYKHSSNRSFHSAHSDPDDFSIGTCRSDSDDTLPHTTSTSAASNTPLSASAATLSSSDEQRRAEPAVTQQNLPKEDQTRASSSPHPAASFSTAAPSSTAESAASSAAVQQPSGSSAQTLQSGSPNTVVQAATPVGVSSNQKQPMLKSPKVASTDMANQPRAQGADESIAAGHNAGSSTSASTTGPAAKSEQVGSLQSPDLVWQYILPSA